MWQLQPAAAPLVVAAYPVLKQSSLRCVTARGARRHAQGLGDLASARLTCSRGASPCPPTLFFLLCGRKSAPTCQKSGGFHQGEVFRGRFSPLDTGGCDGRGRKRPGRRRSRFQTAPFLLVPSFRVDENYSISGRTPPENARRHAQGACGWGRAFGIMLLRDKNPRIVLYGSAPTTVARCLAFLEYTRQL